MKKLLRLIVCVLVTQLSACTGGEQTTNVNIEMRAGQEKFGCTKPYIVDQESWQLGQAQFYIADIKLQDKRGNWQVIPLKETASQTAEIALIGQNCAASDNGNWQLSFDGQINWANYQKIAFNLGVPFELNHLNPLAQKSPLNVSSMFWVWQTGHKFLRLELQNNSDDWVFHLGSTGCQSPSVMRSPTNTCRYPNLYAFEMPVDANVEVIVFDLAVLLSDVALSPVSSCQSEHDNDICQQLFANLTQGKNNQMFRALHDQ